RRRKKRSSAVKERAAHLPKKEKKESCGKRKDYSLTPKGSCRNLRAMKSFYIFYSALFPF
ncbi:hypothetical protein V7122_14445, partial [Bacillus sp. JJ1532]|uniref:hypothetical protein n=1 Tax=Bacillus sp. JJ1532 TaxID=3122958 RepID=UPI0030009588